MHASTARRSSSTRIRWRGCSTCCASSCTSPARRKDAAKASAAPARCLIDGELVNSCLVPLLQAEGTSITTIEGVASGERLHAVQEAFIAHGGAQCGICTPGMVLAAVSLLASVRRSRRRRDPRRPGRQPVPLHRLHEDLRGRAPRDGRAYARAVRAYAIASFRPSICAHRAIARRRAGDARPSSRAPWRPFAGGTDLMVLLEAGQAAAPAVRQPVGLCASCAASRSTDDEVTLGALTTFTDVLTQPSCSAPSFRCSAAPRPRPAASPPRIAARSAATSPTPRRPPIRRRRCSSTTRRSSWHRRAAAGVVPYDRFHPGYKQMDLAPDELITAVRLPRRQRVDPALSQGRHAPRAGDLESLFRRPRRAWSRSGSRDVRLAFGSVAPTVVRAAQAEAALTAATPDRDTIARGARRPASRHCPDRRHPLDQGVSHDRGRQSAPRFPELAPDRLIGCSSGSTPGLARFRHLGRNVRPRLAVKGPSASSGRP